jgi:hypothetical protein
MFGLGKGQKFDLIRAPFGRRGSGFYLFEDYNLPLIRLSNTKADSIMSGGNLIFDLKLLQNGRPVRYYYFGDAGSLQITQYGEVHGTAEIVLTELDHLRIRGNCGLRLELRSMHEGNGAIACKGVFPFLDGSGTEVFFGAQGKMFFKSLEGSVCVKSEYDKSEGKYKSLVVEITPDEKTDHYDIAIHEYMNGEFRYDGVYEPFDKLVADNKADFEEFKKNYRKAAADYQEAAEYAMWLIWTHRVKPGGFVKSPMILMHLQWLNACCAWQQSLHACAMLGNPKEGWRQICSLFEHQNEKTGQLPGMVFYSGGGAIQAPFQGFALDYLIRRCGDSFLTPEECKRMYPKFAKWTNYWTTYRSAKRGDDLISVKSPHDSGWDDASIFKDGFPASTPDLIAFLVALMYSTARLAKGAGEEEASKDWTSRADRLLNTLITEYWDGERFIARKNGVTPVDSWSLANYQPILLGDRLPKHIIDKVAEKLTTEGEYLSPIGLCTESMKSPLCSFVNQFVLGRVVAPANMIITAGLYIAGKKKEAAMIARRLCDKMKDEGMILGFAPYDRYPLTGEKIEFNVPPGANDPWPWSGWAAGSFMTMASTVIED